MDEFSLSIGAPGTPQTQAESAEEWTDAGDGLGDELAVAGEAPMVAEDAVRSLLVSLGVAANTLHLTVTDDVGRELAPNLWRFTDLELVGLVPPLTRIINARPVLREAMARSDYATVAIALAGYTGRNASAITRARRERAPADDHLDRESSPGMDLLRAHADDLAGQPPADGGHVGDAGSGLPHGPVGG